MKRIVSALLALVMILALIPVASFEVSAATALDSPPYAKVEYGYTTEVQAGTIRYMCQSKKYASNFDSRYWPTGPLGYNPDTGAPYYSGPSNECGTCCVSMGLSYVGINKTPKEILEKYGGVTNFSGWGADLLMVTNRISSAMDDYINGNGKYSPLMLQIAVNTTGRPHWVMLAGKVTDNVYMVVDPADHKGGQMTINGNQITYKGHSSYTKDVRQYYNKDAYIGYLSKCISYPCFGTVEVTCNTTYMKSLPCSGSTDASSATIGPAKKGAQYEAIGLYRNSVGNLWYKIRISDSQEGYIFGGDVKFDFAYRHYISDLSIDNVAAPSKLTAGSSFPLKGEISTKYLNIAEVRLGVHQVDASSVTLSGTVEPNTKYYNIAGSAADKAIKFGSLSADTYIYWIVVKLQTNYAASGTEIATRSTDVVLYETTFEVVAPTEDTTTPGTPVLNHSVNGNQVTFTWDATVNTTHYNLWLDRKNASGEWESVEQIFYAANGVSRTFTEGEYRAQLLSYNSKAYESDGSDWRHTWAEDVFFNIGCSHSYTAKVTAPTCTSQGYTTYTCSKCSHSYVDGYTDSLSHTFGDWTLADRPYSDAEGRITRTCSSCGGLQSQTLPPFSTADYSYQLIEDPTYQQTGKASFTWKNTSYGVWKFDVTLARVEVDINESNFPDAAFREYIRTNFDTNGNGALHYTEISEATVIDVNGKNISSLKGIEFFTGLTELYCSENPLGSFDISSNQLLEHLSCGDTQLTSLDVSNNPFLTSLYCYNNQLSTLDVRSNTKLRYLECHENNLTNLDVSHNPVLTELSCVNNNLTILDLSRNTAIERVYCSANQLACLDLSQNTALTNLLCSRNKATITVESNNCFDLGSLSGFDVSKASNWVGGTVSGSILTVEPDATEITYSYDCGNDKKVTFTLSIEKTLAAISVSRKPAKLGYLEGKENLDVSGGQITLTYHNGMTEVVDMTTSMVAGFDNAKVGKQTLTVTYQGKTATFEVEILKSYIPGDANGDETVTDADAIYLLYNTLLPDLYPVKIPCDFNGDGAVTDADAIYLLYHTLPPDLYPLR